MQYTFNEAYEKLSQKEKLIVRVRIKRILDIGSNMQFYRIMRGETPLRAGKIEAIESEFKKFGIKKVWD